MGVYERIQTPLNCKAPLMPVELFFPRHLLHRQLLAQETMLRKWLTLATTFAGHICMCCVESTHLGIYFT